MSAPPVDLEPAVPADLGLLANLLELYAYDLSDAFALDVGPDGKFGYPRLPLYFREPEQRFPWLIRSGVQLAGFALVTRGSPATSDPSHLDVAEFFVLRRYRRAGVGSQAATRLFDRMPGHWVVRVAECNAAALPFWNRVIADYTSGATMPREFLGAGKRWTVFEFDTP